MEGWNSLHDTVFDATGADLNETQLKRVFAALPDDIRAEARKYGLSDTDARGEVSMWLRSNGLPPVDYDYQLNGKLIEDDAPCALTFCFASATDMLVFAKMVQNFDNAKMGIRAVDALDQDKCHHTRQFVASATEEVGSRLAVVKKETEVI